MQDKEENKVKSFTGLNRTCRLESSWEANSCLFIDWTLKGPH